MDIYNITSKVLHWNYEFFDMGKQSADQGYALPTMKYCSSGFCFKVGIIKNQVPTCQLIALYRNIKYLIRVELNRNTMRCTIYKIPW